MKDKCCYCGEERKSPKARGWSPCPDGLSCGKCWKDHWIARAIALPLAGPAVPEDVSPEGRKAWLKAEWERLRAALIQSWEESTALANWAQTELLKADCVRLPGMEKLPPAPRLNLYALMNQQPYSRRSAWEGCAGSASSVVKKVQDLWNGDKAKGRFAVIWLRKAAPSTYRYPFPWPVRRQEWRASFGPQRSPCVSVTLPGGRFDLRLRGGPEFARQLAHFTALVKGEAVGGEMTIYRQRASKGCHRRVLTDREPNGGARTQYRELVKIVVWLRRATRPRDAEHTLLVRTDPNAFWVAEMEGRAPWILNADHVRQWIAEHRVFLQRISEDTKYEKRWPRRKRMQINEYRTKRCLKHQRRIDTWCKQAAALLANYAQRCHVAEVIYDDTGSTGLRNLPESLEKIDRETVLQSGAREYVESFPWHRLALAVKNKLEEVGIGMIARADVVNEDDQEAQVLSGEVEA